MSMKHPQKYMDAAKRRRRKLLQARKEEQRARRLKLRAAREAARPAAA